MDPRGTLKRCSNRGAPTRTCRPATVARTPCPGMFSKASITASLAKPHRSTHPGPLGQRVATPCLRGTRQTEELNFLGADSDNVGHPWLALGQRARLVEDDRLDLGGLFKRNPPNWVKTKSRTNGLASLWSRAWARRGMP